MHAKRWLLFAMVLLSSELMGSGCCGLVGGIVFLVVFLDLVCMLALVLFCLVVCGVYVVFLDFGG